MKARNEVRFLFNAHDAIELQVKSGQGALGKPINYHLDCGMTHSFSISTLSASITSWQDMLDSMKH